MPIIVPSTWLYDDGILDGSREFFDRFGPKSDADEKVIMAFLFVHVHREHPLTWDAVACQAQRLAIPPPAPWEAPHRLGWGVALWRPVPHAASGHCSSTSAITRRFTSSTEDCACLWNRSHASRLSQNVWPGAKQTCGYGGSS